MDGTGPNTNTRTIEDAIGEAIDQLSGAPQTARVARLLVEVRRYQAVVASWEQEPPPPDVQFEVIGELMSVLGKAMNVARDSGPLEVQKVDAPSVTLGPDGPTSDREAAPRRRRKLPSLELEMPRTRAPATPPGPPRQLDDVLQIGGRLDPVGGEDGSCPEGNLRLIHAHRLPWREASEGIWVRSITGLGTSPHHVMVRLAPGAELPEHVHGTPELIMVWDGCVEVGDDLLYAGGCVVAASGDVGPTIRGVGEGTIVLFDTDRRFGEL
ncbi:MAG: hypothetical protein RIF41_12450 [Polyangiaceae bacterium]